jgi:hypothetical protein
MADEVLIILGESQCISIGYSSIKGDVEREEPRILLVGRLEGARSTSMQTVFNLVYPSQIGHLVLSHHPRLYSATPSTYSCVS